MKQFLFKALCAASLFLSVKTINAQCSLDQVGGVNTVTASALSDITAASGGTVYSVSYHSTLNKIFLHSVSIAGSYTTVASISTATTIKPIVKINKANGKVYVVIRDENTGKVGKVFYLSGSSLIQLGPAFSGTNIVTDLSIAFNSLGEEYVAYTDASNGNKSTVKKWDGVSSWVSVGTGTVSSGAGYYNSLVIDNTDTPVLAYQSIVNSSVTAVSKFTGSWVPVGTGTVGLGASNSKIRVASNGDYYLGYTELSGKVIVQKYNGTWMPLGSPVSAMSFSANTFDLDLDPADIPYFISQNNTSYYAVSYKYTGVPTWSNVIGGNLSAVSSGNLNVSIDNTGNPYFFYVDQSNGSGLNIKTITSPVSISTQPISVTRCNGQSGSFSVGTSGGAPNSYQWQTSTGLNFINSSAPYSGFNTNILSFTSNPSMNQNKLRCVVDLGCKNNISNAAILTVSSTTITPTTTNPTCFNTNDGAIITSVSGGIAPYSYSWNTGATTSNITSLYMNTYTLNVLDNASCTTTTAITLISPPSISTSFSGNMTICNGGSTTLTITATVGTGPLTYVWSPGGSLSATTGSIVTANPSSTQTYNVQITDANACVVTNTVMVNVDPLPTVTPAANVTICQGSSANIFASGTAHTYTWNPGNLIGASAMVSPMATTIYTIVGTNTLTGCTNTANQTVFVNILPTANAGTTRTLTCVNTSTTLAGSTVGGVTYNWSGPGIVSGATTLSPTINLSGTYSFVSMSAAGCVSATSTVAVIQNTTSPSPTASTTGTLTCSALTVALIGAPSTGVSYQWTGPSISGSSNTQSTSANSSGTYTLTIIDVVNGCSASATTAVTQNTTTPIAAFTKTNTTCNSLCDGAITSTISGGVGPYTYSWTPGGLTTQNISALCAGNYTLTVTGSNGCSSTSTVDITQPNVITPNITTSPVTCFNACNGSITSSPSGGMPPFTYTLITPTGTLNTGSATNQCAGSYTLGIQDMNGCIITPSFNLIQPNQITASIFGNQTVCSGNSTALSINVTGGTPAYIVNWTPSSYLNSTTAFNVTASPITNQSYTVSVTDANGCIVSSSITLTVSPLPAVSISGATNICNGSTTNLMASGATSYTWNSGANTTSISVSPTITTSYSITGEDANGCVNTATTSVNIIAAKNISGVITNTAGTTSGDLILYKYTPSLSMWDSITTVPLSSNYSFTSIDSSLYVIRAIPTATNIQVTYADSAISWQNATVINHGCTNNTNQNIKLIPLDNLGGGPGILTGFIIQDDGFGARISNEFKPLVPGQPIGGIIVKGGRNPGGNMFTQTTTNGATGGFTLTNIPLNTGTDHYFVYVDIPGLDTSASYHKVIDATNTVHQNLNFSVDSMYIKPIGEITTIKNNNSLLNNTISVFPNPANNFVNIQYELIQSADIQITLYDVIGNKIQDIVRTSTLEKNKYNHSIKTEYLSSGIYFIKVNINNSENTVKLIVSK